MANITIAREGRLSFPRFLRGILTIAGTTIGAGMLGVPLVTADAGFWPAFLVNFGVWIFVLCTGLLYAEVTLWMPEGTNILSTAHRFLGTRGKILIGGLFLFLYYCLMVAYFAAGAPILSSFFSKILGVSMEGWVSNLVFGVVFAAIVSFGSKWMSRMYFLVTIAMVGTYLILVGTGSSEVQMDRLISLNVPSFLFVIPVLFSAIGYHHVIPSLHSYLGGERKALRLSVFFGTTIPLFIFVIWQWVVLGSLPKQAQALHAANDKAWMFEVGQYFAFFVIVTSMLGVAFSLVDFFSVTLKTSKFKIKRPMVVFATFFPPFVIAGIQPALFDQALGIAGGFGEAFLNGLIPPFLVWMGHKASHRSSLGGKLYLGILLLLSLFVIGLEAYYLVFR